MKDPDEEGQYRGIPRWKKLCLGREGLLTYGE